MKWTDIKLDRKSIRQFGSMLTQVADIMESGVKSAEALGRIRVTIDFKPETEDEPKRKER